LYVACHFWGDGSPFIFTREEAKHPNFNLKVIADISCDIDGPVASTLRPSIIPDPIYGYNAQTESEVAYDNQDAITVMAVDNLPCELPKDASTDFGAEFIKNIFPALINGDKDEILKRASITKDGELTERYEYLTEYAAD
jgi:alanine dehydrogenase